LRALAHPFPPVLYTLHPSALPPFPCFNLLFSFVLRLCVSFIRSFLDAGCTYSFVDAQLSGIAPFFDTSLLTVWNQPLFFFSRSRGARRIDISPVLLAVFWKLAQHVDEEHSGGPFGSGCRGRGSLGSPLPITRLRRREATEQEQRWKSFRWWQEQQPEQQ
jgi:hypothetical protein